MGYSTFLIFLVSLKAIAVQSQKDHHCAFDKNVIVQLHGWKYTDIQEECEASNSRYYCGFQVSPPTEHQYMTLDLPPDATHPWWQRYNTVSYSISNSDGGTNADFERMIAACNANNVRIYVEFEVNNMGDQTDGTGSAGNYYQGQPGFRSYPGVPFNEVDFHAAEGECPTTSGAIENPSDRIQLRNCNRRSTPRSSDSTYLNDLKTETTHVRDIFIQEMDNLIDLGVAGFRLAHARWVEPADIEYVANSLKDLVLPSLPPSSRPFIYQEVIPDTIVDTAEYNAWGRVEETNAGRLLADIIRRQSGFVMANLTEWGPNMGLMSPEDAIVFIDDPASQRGWTGNWVDEGIDLELTLTFREMIQYEKANAFMLAHTYGIPRIHSSFNWDRIVVDGTDINEYQGPPRHAANDTIMDVEVDPNNGHACVGYWNCEHRNNAITGMVTFNNLANYKGANTIDNWWSNGRNQIAFSRANFGFIAINNEPSQVLNAKIYTGMAPGDYCDFITGDEFDPATCSGATITVDADGRADILIPGTNDATQTGVIAILDYEATVPLKTE